MSTRSRTYTFTIDKHNKEDWEYICTLENKGICEYISACKTRREIKGFIRFANAKSLNSVHKIFNDATTIQLVANNDLYYRDIFSKRKCYFESGKQAKKQNKKSDTEISELLERVDRDIQGVQGERLGANQADHQYLQDDCEKHAGQHVFVQHEFEQHGQQ